MKLNTLSDTELRQHLANVNNLIKMSPPYCRSLELQQAKLWDELQRRSFLATLPVKSKPVGRWDIR